MKSIPPLTGFSRSSLFLFIFIFTLEKSFSQALVTGYVTGKKDTPLAGAVVTILTTGTAVSANDSGKFYLWANSGTEINISHTGYVPRRMMIGTGKEIHVSLSEDIIILDELIAVGYGNARRRDITGAVARISSKDFTPGTINNPLQLVQGKVAGVVIVRPGGDPNGDFLIRIRGATSLEGQPPLLVINGVAIDDFNRALTTLNPEDIESFDILKDASAAAIYGARGGNGVILITTKTGSREHSLVDYHSYAGMERVSNQLKVLTAERWRSATAAIGGGGLDEGANMNWQDAVTRTGYSHSHNLSINGGSNSINFRGSIGYIKQEGVVINTGKEMVTALVTANQKTRQ